jgi:tRNA pseudouridine38-40 synthase
MTHGTCRGAGRSGPVRYAIQHLPFAIQVSHLIDLMPRRTLKLVIAYDGTDYVGWQRQARGSSIQGLIEDALAPFEGRAITVHGAGRTDAGVHALAQTASVSMESGHGTVPIQRGLNVALPRSIRIVSVEEAAPAFHARYDSTGKTYEYRLVNAPFMSPFLTRYAWHVPQPLDLAAMRAAAARLVGRRDFAAFQGTGSSIQDTVRTVEAIEWSDVTATGEPLVISVRAGGFLRHMVRNIAGTLVDAGLGRWDAEGVDAIVRSRDRRRAGRTAPPQGLFLSSVRY